LSESTTHYVLVTAYWWKRLLAVFGTSCTTRREYVWFLIIRGNLCWILWKL